MEILALEAGQGRQPLATPTLVAFSTATGKRLWVEKLMAYFRPQEGGPASKWPLAADLDGDGCAEVVVPDRGSLPPSKCRPLRWRSCARRSHGPDALGQAALARHEERVG